MDERLAALLAMTVGVMVWWSRPVVASLREWRRERRRYAWDRRDEFLRAREAFGQEDR